MNSSGRQNVSNKKLIAPTSTPGAAYTGTIIAVGLLGLSAIAAHDLVVKANWISDTPWYERAFQWIADLRWQDWMWPAAVALVVLGLALLWVAIKPRRHSHVGIYDEYTWTRRGDLARRASAVAATVDGVLSAQTVVGGRRATVKITTDHDVRDAVTDTVSDSLSDTAKSIKVVVKQTISSTESAPGETAWHRDAHRHETEEAPV